MGKKCQEMRFLFSSSQGNEKDGETLGIKKRHRLFLFPLPSLLPFCSLLLVAKSKGIKEGVLQRAIPLAISIFFSPAASRSRIVSMWAYFE